MKNKTLRILNYSIAFLVCLAVAFIYPKLPDRIPTRWGFNGAVSYDSKSTIWIIAAMLPCFAFLFDLAPHIDPRRNNYQKFDRFYDGFCVGMQLFLSVVIGIIIRESFFPGQIRAAKVILLMVSVMLLLIGNYLPKVQSNFYMGIKTPWTLSSDKVWRKTHRLGGRLYAGCGLLSLLAVLILPENMAGITLLTLVIGSTVAVTIASWLWWKKDIRR